MLGEDLIQPTKIYVKPVLPLIKKIFAISHITGGGIYENLERIIPNGMNALIDFKNFIIPERFVWLKELGVSRQRKCSKLLIVVLG